MSLLLVDYNSDDDALPPWQAKSGAEEEIISGSEPDSPHSSDNLRDSTKQSEHFCPQDHMSLADAVSAAVSKGDSETANKLPSARDVFSEIPGPPEYLYPTALAPVVTATLIRNGVAYSASTSSSASATVSAPAVIDYSARDNSAPGPAAGGADQVSGSSESQRFVGAQLPPKEDASALLGVCPSCEVPKTFSSAKGGLVCPLCGDRGPLGEAGAKEAKRKTGAVKDKEKMKRMKGQSSHATWKSETEMQLRQTFD